jgi:TolB-like protein/DNA-binding winged helix-turn-helix (wHTH) protein/cytochrome c-type biogenesis protein CcmH/NrfG
VSSRKFRFDGWVLDPESGDLEREGTRIRLQEQPVQVLRALISDAGNVVTRAQLIALLWPKSVVDFDAGLNTVIRKLRTALGDTSETPRYIETLPRRGYRFVGTLDPDPEAAPPAVLVSTGSPGPALPLPDEPTTLAETARSAGAKPKSNGNDPAAWDETPSSTATPAPVQHSRSLALSLIAALAVLALVIGVYALWRAQSGAGVASAPWQSRLAANAAATNAYAGAFNPPPHSIAVLPFVNLSGDKEQEYFSDGLTEELLNSLAHIEGLQVAARTSSFSFRERPDIAEVARKLNVATVLEGSVRRSGHTVRITAQLVNAATGFHLWSKTYDRDLGDVLKLQTEIATEVARALEVTLLGDLGAKIEPGGTSNPAAFDAYLRGSKAYEFGYTAQDVETAIAAFSEAIRLDSKYALALAGRSTALIYYAGSYAQGAAAREDLDKALADARQAITVAPELAEAHLALSYFFQDGALDFAQASAELERAVALAPGSALAIGSYGQFAVLTGRPDEGIAAARRAVALDPLNPESHYRLGEALYFARHYGESAAAFGGVLALEPKDTDSPGARGLAYYGLGDFQQARASCEARPDNETSQWCLALTYHKLARHADAEAELAKLTMATGDRWAYRRATIYAQWGNAPRALEELDRALRLRLPELRWLKADPLMDSVRNDARFQQIERALNFPN